MKERSDSKSKYSEDDIITILEFLIDHIFVVLCESFSNRKHITIETHCTLFHYHTKRNNAIWTNETLKLGNIHWHPHIDRNFHRFMIWIPKFCLLSIYENTLSLPDTWLRPVLEWHILYLLGPIFSKDFWFSGCWSSNIPRNFPKR